MLEMATPFEAGSPSPQAGPSAVPSGSSASAPELRTRGLQVTARQRPILRDVDLTVAAGSLCALVGPSGVGKSTLLKCFNRLVDLTPALVVRGEVRIGSRVLYGERSSRERLDVDLLRQRVGMLFQRPVVFPKSIFENVLFGLRRVGTAEQPRVPKAEWPDRAEAVLRRVGLWSEVADRLGEPATQLSVGQQQRLCLARTLALEPEVLLMDEPTSALDPASTAEIERLARALAGRVTILWVTHDPAQAQRLADTLVRMEAREGVGTIASQTSPPSPPALRAGGTDSENSS